MTWGAGSAEGQADHRAAGAPYQRRPAAPVAALVDRAGGLWPVSGSRTAIPDWPDRCRDEFGFADAGRILALVRQHAVLWFDQPDLPVEEEAALALLERWLQ